MTTTTYPQLPNYYCLEHVAERKVVTYMGTGEFSDQNIYLFGDGAGKVTCAIWCDDEKQKINYLFTTGDFGADNFTKFDGWYAKEPPCFGAGKTLLEIHRLYKIEDPEQRKAALIANFLKPYQEADKIANQRGLVKDAVASLIPPPIPSPETDVKLVEQHYCKSRTDLVQACMFAHPSMAKMALGRSVIFDLIKCEADGVLVAACEYMHYIRLLMNPDIAFVMRLFDTFQELSKTDDKWARKIDEVLPGFSGKHVFEGITPEAIKASFGQIRMLGTAVKTATRARNSPFHPTLEEIEWYDLINDHYRYMLPSDTEFCPTKAMWPEQSYAARKDMVQYLVQLLTPE